MSGRAAEGKRSAMLSADPCLADAVLEEIVADAKLTRSP